MTAETWIPPPLWTVPRDWPGARCFVLCSGESVAAQRATIAQLAGRFIAVKHGVLTRPDADVLFLSGERTPEIAADLIPQFYGTHIIVRGRSDVSLPPGVKRITRSKDHTTLCTTRTPTHVCGRDAGTSAINLAFHFGATEIVLVGYDMTGGHFCPHPLQYPPKKHFLRHVEHLDALAADAREKGIRIVNCSPISRVTCFERRPLESYL